MGHTYAIPAVENAIMFGNFSDARNKIANSGAKVEKTTTTLENFANILHTLKVTGNLTVMDNFGQVIGYFAKSYRTG